MGVFSPVYAPVLAAAFAAEGSRLPWEAAAGPGLPVLNLTTGGTFTRSTEGSYLTGAPTDGSAAFMAWAGVDVRRFEDRGDGLGLGLLIEGSRTNLLFQSRSPANAAWTAGLTVTTTGGAEEGPDGTLNGTRSQVTIDGYARFQQITTAAAGQTVAGSMWVKRKRGLGAGSAHAALPQENGTGGGTGALYINDALGETYVRATGVRTLAANNPVLVPGDGRTVGGFTRAALDFISDLHQLELGAFPTSPIRTLATSVTRGADVLSYAVGQYPASFLDRGFRVVVAPDASSAEIVSAGGMNLVYFGGGATSRLEFSFSGANCQLYSYDSGGVTFIATLTFSRGQQLTISWNQTQVIVAGATTGNGTYAKAAGVMAGGTMHLGTALTTRPFFGRFFRMEAL